MTLIDLGDFPVALFSNHWKAQVYGEVYEIPDYAFEHTMVALRNYEGPKFRDYEKLASVETDEYPRYERTFVFAGNTPETAVDFLKLEFWPSANLSESN